MVSQTRSASSSSSRSGKTATRSTRSASSRSAAARHNGPGTHRSNATGPKQKGRKGKHRILKWFLGIIATLIALGIGFFVFLYVTTEVPQPEKIAMAERTTVYYADGTTKLGSFAEQNREIIDCSTLPKYVGQAIVSSENKSFYTDSGIDLKGIARAFLNNISGGARQGGSTITQQYAERYYLGETKSYIGKLHESILALKISQTQSKDQVLCNYMNTIYLGRGAYGIQAASQAYFGKDAKDLTVDQAALLAGIIPAPSVWDPANDPQDALKRFNRVINIMKDQGYITAKQSTDAKMPQTITNQQQNVYEGPQGYLLQMVREELTGSKAFTSDELDTGGYKIITTIDKAKQDLMYQVSSPSQGGKGIVPDGLEIGAMSVNPKDGSILSLYGGDDYLKKPLNNATQALYEPGSTMKPFALLGAIQAGVSLDTVFNGNSPQRYTGIASPVQNFGNQSFGNINLYSATANSVNTVYMNLQEKLGAAKVAQLANAAGVSPKLVTGQNPFTVLGNDSVHVSDIVQAYATIDNEGNKTTLHIVSKVTDNKGKDLYNAPATSERVFAANDTALVAKAMTGTVQYGTATEARAVGKTLAGKSGTANDGTAGSFVGFSPSLVTVFAMWYPNAQGGPQEIPPFAGYSGGSDYPVHLFTQYMKGALENSPNEAFPVAKDTGKVGGPDGTWGLGGQKTNPAPSPTPSSNGNSQSPAESPQPSPSQNQQETPAPTPEQPTPSPSAPVTPEPNPNPSPSNQAPKS